MESLEESLRREFGFHPVLTGWFSSKYGQPTEVQRLAWLQITKGANTLISSPTGSGKTLAALLPCLHEIAAEKLEQGVSYTPGVRTLVVTPLKALNNDIHHHLLLYIEEIQKRSDERQDIRWPGLQAGVRTGDTKQSTRASMLRTPPDLLVTTPESLYLLLTSPRAREILRTVRHIVVDEIHDLAADKRGMHLSLTLERLEAWCRRAVQRIGVSATQKPIERVAQFLGGWENDTPRHVEIIESKAEKLYSLQVTMPEPARPSADKEALWTPLVVRLLQLMEGCTSTLIFANSRRLCERLTLRLNDHVGYEMARSHHGSVAREKRLEVERMLKDGELRCLVATSSMELGIDVGHVDLVIQIDSPFSAAAGIQRIGRAGHAVGDVSRGVLLARSRTLLPELAVLSRRIAARDIESIRIPRGGLDVLAQQIVAIVSLGDDWDVQSLAKLLARSDSFRWVTRDKLLQMLEVLSGFYPFVRPLLEWNRDSGQLTRLAVTPMAALIGAGTIPQSTAYPVHHSETGLHLGELDEEYIQESSVGDVFQLGTASWRIVRIRPERIYVREAENRYSEIPFWRGEAGGKSFEIGVQTGSLWRELHNRLQAAGESAHSLPTRTTADVETQAWLMATFHMDADSSSSLIAMIRNQMAVAAVPTDRNVVIECFTDEQNHTHYILHSLFGRKFNRTWLMAICRRLAQIGLSPLYTNARDQGLELIFPKYDEAIVHEIMSLTAEQSETLVADAVAQSPMFGAAFQRMAETSLLLSRSFTRMPAWKKRLRGQELLKEALPFRERFPLFQEAMRECIEEHVDITHLREVLTAIARAEIRFSVQRNQFPSPLAGQFHADYAQTRLYESDALAQDVQVELLSFSRQMAAEVFGMDAVREAVSPEAIAAEEKRLSETSVALEQAEDLFRYLKEHGEASLDELKKARLAADASIVEWLNHMKDRGSLKEIRLGNQTYWICADETEYYEELADSASAQAFIFQRFADHRLSFTAEDAASRYDAPLVSVQSWIQAAREAGSVEPAPFAEPGQEQIWTSRKVASRLIRTSLQMYRRNGAAVPALHYFRHMPLRHMATVPAPSGAAGMEGLREIIEALQGFFMPVSLWESLLFPTRQSRYRKQDLDLLCSSGEVFWIGSKEPDDKEGKIAFFTSESSALYEPYLSAALGKTASHPELHRLLREKGASFLSKLGIETGRTPSSLLTDLLDLVWDGRAANDQFATLRLHAQSKGKKPDKFQSGLGRWYALDSLHNPQYDKEASVTAWIQHVLKRYGILTRDLAASLCPYPWETLLPFLRQLEEWGLVVRGLFLQDVAQLQFASKAFLSQLQQPYTDNDRIAGGSYNESLTLIGAVDPANPFGLLLPWPVKQGVSFSRKAGNYLVCQDGRWLLWMENNGKRIYRLDGPKSEVDASSMSQQLKQIFRLMFQTSQLRKIVIDSWDGARIEDAPEHAYLKLLGAERDRASYVLWPSQILG
ncbi:DEAD/DEAH box helicase [Paenibacillus hexagrammi]|uniref:DEAD/DEAH box helicase n=1 Tax=Paenibacillus hexagrammi TaxID=2908839 RepID=A0ABY3SFM9_9BACL|nr:DEAD/DEAH box helicase [Paenibacillus sp. YPD9-1]UJF32049.1 DEAD/DEAH box helicase [Paenibacillus sp. YPD9-1]